VIEYLQDLIYEANESIFYNEIVETLKEIEDDRKDKRLFYRLPKVL